MSSWRDRNPTQNTRGRGGGWRSRGTNMPSRGRTGGPGPSSTRGTTPSMKMEYIATVSRSSGLEKDGDTLKDHRIQEEYRDFIQQKLNDLLEKHPWRPEESDVQRKQRIEVQENVMILFRKLREGVSSSKRADQFALEVYETSLYLCAGFDLPKQTTSIISHLIPDLYNQVPPPHNHRQYSIMISLLHCLNSAYPSQGPYEQHLDSIPLSFFPRDSESRKWISSLVASLRTRNYVKAEQISRRSTVAQLFKGDDEASRALSSLTILPKSSQIFAQRAIFVLLDNLRTKARDTAWAIIRSAYRECDVNAEDTKGWLSRSLYLTSTVHEEHDMTPEQWLEHGIPLGYVRKKEGVEGRWIICKIR